MAGAPFDSLSHHFGQGSKQEGQPLWTAPAGKGVLQGIRGSPRGEDRRPRAGVRAAWALLPLLFRTPTARVGRLGSCEVAGKARGRALLPNQRPRPRISPATHRLQPESLPAGRAKIVFNCPTSPSRRRAVLSTHKDSDPCWVSHVPNNFFKFLNFFSL